MTNCFLFAAFKNVPPVLGFFFFLKVKCVTSVYVFEFILLEFVEILGGIDSCLSRNLGTFQPVFLQVFFSAPFFLSSPAIWKSNAVLFVRV